MADDIFANIPGAGALSGLSHINWVMVGLWTFVIIFIVGIIFTAFFFILWKKKTIKIFEIDIISHRITIYTAKLKRNEATKSVMTWIGKYKKFIPALQQEDMYYVGNNDAAILFKDNNAMHHTMRLLGISQIIELFKQKGIDITKEFIEKTYIDPKDKKQHTIKVENPYYKYYAIYTMPNPHEDLEFLGNQIEEANKEYKDKTNWWNSPTVMILGACFISFMILLVTMLLRNRS